MSGFSRLFITLFLIMLSSHAQAWWNKDWEFRKRIVIDTSPSGVAIGENLVGFAIPVRLHTANFTFFGDMKPDGSDIRFVAGDDKTPLRHHIEHIDATSGIAVIWVGVPAIAPGVSDGHIWMYYGNTSAESVADRSTTFDTSTTLVLHFAEPEGFPIDATAYANAVTESTAKLGQAGVIGSGAEFNAQSTVKVVANPVLKVAADPGFTLSTWVKLGSSDVEGRIYTQGGPESAQFSLGVADNVPYARLQRTPDEDKKRSPAANKTTATVTVQAAAPLQSGRWYHLAVTVADKVRLYVDGDEVASAATPSGFASVGPINLGTAGESLDFLGTLDELSVSKAARSPNWIRAVALGQGTDGKLIAYGEDEAFDTASAAGTYLSLLWSVLATLSLDGWVIIGIIFIMGFISADAAIHKLMTLRRTEKADEAFLKHFASLPADQFSANPSAQMRQEFGDSSLFRVHQSGLSDVGQFLDMAERGGYGRVLTPQALESVRSSLDEGFTGEITRLNARLATLTVAISGAPFMGLLGTVFGVMITFASVAASGDVNVNTIAPGVSAALATTVAGLIVAIPALFMYNHLAGRIIRRTTAMEVFSDRLVSKLAVAHSGLSQNENKHAA